MNNTANLVSGLMAAIMASPLQRQQARREAKYARLVERGRCPKCEKKRWDCRCGK